MNVNGPSGPLTPKTTLSGGAVRKGDILKRGADVNHMVTATAAAQPTGVAMDNADAAERQLLYAFTPGERILVRSGAAFAIDVRLASDATGRAVLATTTQPVVGIAREAATAADQWVAIELVQPFTLAP
jgi:hypothetical protein